MNLKREGVTGDRVQDAVQTAGTGRASGRSRRRGAELEEAILDAAWKVLVEQGYAGFTFEAVAARACTSRPVLSRRWPQHGDLLQATVTRFWRSQPITVPDTGNLRDDAIEFLRNADVSRARMMTLLSVQIMDYFRESGTSLRELRDAVRPAGEPAPFATIVARAVERGELVDRARSLRVVSLPFDLHRHEVFMTMQPVGEETLREIVDDVWLPLLEVPGDVPEGLVDSTAARTNSRDTMS